MCTIRGTNRYLRVRMRKANALILFRDVMNFKGVCLALAKKAPSRGNNL